MHPLRLRLALALSALSGCAALGYQVVWTQQAALWLGHESAAVLAVVAALFGGIALGTWAVSAPVERSTRPARWYVACEALIGAWGLVLAWAAAPALQVMLQLVGPDPGPWRQWGVAFTGTFLLLLPASAAMGATLPALERALEPLRAEGRSVAGLYAANTAGAVLGVLAAAFWWVPAFGLWRTAAICALCNALAALAAVALPARSLPAGPPLGGRERGLPALLVATGLLGIAYEVLVVRVLAQVAENTVYTFAIVLAVYLAGTALGAAVVQRLRPHWSPHAVLLALGAACGLGTASLWGAPALKQALVQAGGGMAWALTAEAAIALLAFGAPTLVMGALFSLLAARAVAGGLGLGRALAFNTLGAAAAPALAGVLLLPAAGPKAALLAVCAGYVALAAGRLWRQPRFGLVAGALAALALWAPPLAFVEVPEGGSLRLLREGAMGVVTVVRSADGVDVLRIDHKAQEGSSHAVVADARQALLPVLLHPGPRQALFLGLGTGITASAAAADRALQVQVVELLPDVAEAARLFQPAWLAPAERLDVRVADARRHVRAGSASLDLVVADNFHPARSGSGSLYTVEHFAAVRARLKADGVFCQWLPLHQMDLPTLRSVVAAFLAVFPDANAMLATHSLETPVLGLVAGPLPAPSLVQARLQSTTLELDPADFGLPDAWAVLGSFVAGPQALARLAAGAPVNTDDRPVVAYAAPRLAYEQDSRPRDRLYALLDALGPARDDLMPALTDTAERARLAAYWSARDGFLRAGRDVRPVGDPGDMLRQTGEPLLAVLRTSPDFAPAYEPLLRMAQALGARDPDAARRWLQALKSAQPQRTEAADALARLPR